MRRHFASNCLVLCLTGAISVAAESDAGPHIQTIICDIPNACEEARDWQRKCVQSTETVKVLYHSGHQFQPALFLAVGNGRYFPFWSNSGPYITEFGKASVSRDTGTTVYHFGPHDSRTGFLLEKLSKQSGHRFEYTLTDCGLS